MKIFLASIHIFKTRKVTSTDKADPVIKLIEMIFDRVIDAHPMLLRAELSRLIVVRFPAKSLRAARKRAEEIARTFIADSSKSFMVQWVREEKTNNGGSGGGGGHFVTLEE